MTFQFACRKPPSGKDLEPASPDSWILNRQESIFKKKEGIALITGYPDNHCLITRYPDNRYETRLTQPIRAAHPFDEIPLYICRESSTNQLLFMQNKPNFRKAKMNVNIYYTKVYKNETAFRRGKNKPNSNPIFLRTKMNVNLYVIEDYENEPPSGPKKQTQTKPISSKAKIACRKIWPHPNRFI